MGQVLHKYIIVPFEQLPIPKKCTIFENIISENFEICDELNFIQGRLD